MTAIQGEDLSYAVIVRNVTIRARIGGGDQPKGVGDFGLSVAHFLAPKAPKYGNF